MIKAQCDRCGKQEDTPGGVVNIRGRGLVEQQAFPRLPKGWRRIEVPAAEVGAMASTKETCSACLDALRAFYSGDGAVAGLLEPETLERVEEEHEHDFDRLHGMCRCGSTYADVLERTATMNKDGVEVAESDPRPNLTERARKIATGKATVSEAAGLLAVGEMTAPCPNAGDDFCDGTYQRGEFHWHMRSVHGVPVAEGSQPCPFCSSIYPGEKLGAHIADEHPGEWQAWADKRGR
jgi:hypothetical protein